MQEHRDDLYLYVEFDIADFFQRPNFRQKISSEGYGCINIESTPTVAVQIVSLPSFTPEIAAASSYNLACEITQNQSFVVENLYLKNYNALKALDSR